MRRSSVFAGDEARSKALDSRIYIVHRTQAKLQFDTIVEGKVTLDQTGVVSYPDHLINQMFGALYESDAAKAIRRSGLLGIAALVNGYNALAATMCSDISTPFDTVLFLDDGIFPFSGGVTKLPVATFI